MKRTTECQPQLLMPINCHDKAKNPQHENKDLPNIRAQTLKNNCSICDSISERRLCRMILRYVWKLYNRAEWAEHFPSRSCRRREGKGTAPQGTQPSAAGHISASVHSNHKSAHSCIHMHTHLEFDLYFVTSYKECMKWDANQDLCISPCCQSLWMTNVHFPLHK